MQLESLPNAAVVHLWPFFKLLSSFLESCFSQEDPLSDDQHWTVKSVVYMAIYRISAQDVSLHMEDK